MIVWFVVILWLLCLISVSIGFYLLLSCLRRIERLEQVVGQLGPTAERRLIEGGTQVLVPPRWEDELEFR